MAINAKDYDPALMQGANIDITLSDVSIDDLTVGDDAAIGGDLAVTATSNLTGLVTATAGVTTPAGIVTKSGTAVPATAGAIAAGAPITMFSTGIKIWVTSDAPTHSATKGDLCLNTGGSSTSTRLYINNGTTNWVAITTAS